MNNLQPPSGPPIGGLNSSLMDAKADIGSRKQRSPAEAAQESIDATRDISRRLRILEEQYTNVRKNIQVTDQSTIKTAKDMKNDVAVFHSELNEIKSDINELKDELKLIVAELKETAKKEDVMVIDRYLNLWEPVKFTTQKDVENIVRRMIQNK